MKYSTAEATWLSLSPQAERQPETLVTKPEFPHQQSGLAVSVHSVVWIQVFKQRGRTSGHVVAGKEADGLGAEETETAVLPPVLPDPAAGVVGAPAGTVPFPKAGGTTLEVAARVVHPAGMVQDAPLP